MKTYIRDGWLILLLAVLFGAGLSGVQKGLSGKIQENKKADTMSQIPNLTPGAVRGDPMQYGELLVYKTWTAQNEQAGWVVAASGQGFADRIELLIGLNHDASIITGLYVLFQNETPGLGNKIVDEGEGTYRAQFVGKSALEPLTVTKNREAAVNNNKIDAVTGATISSDSVVDIVNRAVRSFRAQLAMQKEAQ